MWKNWTFWRNKRKTKERLTANKEMLDLYHEISSAKRDWENALRHFEYALGKDQVDYAIFAIEAAEKRYEMLLRKAKKLDVKWPAWQKGVSA